MSSSDPSSLRLNVITLFSRSFVCTNTEAARVVMLLDTSFPPIFDSIDSASVIGLIETVTQLTEFVPGAGWSRNVSG